MHRRIFLLALIVDSTGAVRARVDVRLTIRPLREVFAGESARGRYDFVCRQT
jgi:hypothetical protein